MNVLGAHDDPNITQQNVENKCYNMENEVNGWIRFKSGVMNVETCNMVKGQSSGPPFAISQPHFYNADPSFRQAVQGLSPSKEKHEFYMDVVPEFGFPLSIMIRFQLNIIIFGMDDVDHVKNIGGADVVLPLLWAGSGFQEPSADMAGQIKFGLEAPHELPIFAAAVLIPIGSALLLIALGYLLWQIRGLRSADGNHHAAT